MYNILEKNGINKNGDIIMFGITINSDEQNSGKSKAELERVSEESYMQIYRYCYKSLESKEEYAYDITNEVFVLLCEKWDSLEKERIKAWLYRAADNLLKEFFRKHRKRLKELTSIEETGEYGGHHLSYEQNFDNISDDDIERYRDEILDALSDDEKDLFDMVFTEKMPYDEICGELFISKGTFKKRLYRLRQKIGEAVYAKIHM